MHGNLRDRPLLDTVYGFSCHLRFSCCEGPDATCEPCHSNQAKHGKGGAMKAHDCFVVPGCRSCHVELDQGRTMSKDEKREAWDAAYLEFLPEWFKSGIIGVLKRFPRQ